MQHTAAEVIAVFHRDMIAGVIAIVLITMGAGMLLLGVLTAGKSRRSFVYTGLFAKSGVMSACGQRSVRTPTPQAHWRPRSSPRLRPGAA